MTALCIAAVILGLIVWLGSGGSEPDVRYEPDDEERPE